MKHRFSPTERRNVTKSVLVVLLIAASASSILFLGYCLIPQPAQVSDQGALDMGNATCIAGMTTTAMYDSSVVDFRNDLPNNPFVLGDKAVDSLAVVVTVDLEAVYVDWSTLRIDVGVTANELLIASWSWSGLEGGTVGSGTLTRSGNCTVLLLQVLSTPDRIENGIEFYDLLVISRVTAHITDLNGNELSDEISLANTWTFEVRPDSGSVIINPPTNPPAPTFEKSDGVTTAAAGAEVAITFKPRSDYALRYELRVNAQLVRTGGWSGEDISYLLTVVQGLNNVILTVFDTFGQTSSYTHSVAGGTTETTPSDYIPTGDPGPASQFLTSPVGIMSMGIASVGVALGAIVLLRRRRS